jgi:hypothetical protein
MEQEHVILTTLYLVGAKNTNSWCARKGDLHHDFPLDILLVPSLKLSFIANGNHPIGVSLTPGSAICFGSLEFTTDHLSHLSFSPQEWDSSVVFVGMVHNGSPSLHTTLKESSDEYGAALGAWESFGSPNP